MSSIAQVKSDWVDGNLVFSGVDGTVLLTIDSANAKVLIPEIVATSFALATKATFQDDVADVTGTVTDVKHNLAVAAINGIQDALIAAGLMDAS